jgi:methanogenic corrinoid protein MtbC1
MGCGQSAAAYVSLLSERREAETIQLVKSLRDRGVPLRAIYVDLFQAALDEVHRARAAHEVSAAEETFFMQATQRIMSVLATNVLRTTITKGTAVCAAFGRGRGNLQLRIASALLAIEGYDVCQLAPDFPFEELDVVLAHERPSIFVFWADSAAQMEHLARAIERVRTSRLGACAFIVVMGTLFANDPSLRRVAGADAFVARPSDLVGAVAEQKTCLGEAR